MNFLAIIFGIFMIKLSIYVKTIVSETSIAEIMKLIDVEVKADEERMTNADVDLPNPMRFDGTGGQRDYTTLEPPPDKVFINVTTSEEEREDEERDFSAIVSNYTEDVVASEELLNDSGEPKDI